jgi:hypothetical protein
MPARGSRGRWTPPAPRALVPSPAPSWEVAHLQEERRLSLLENGELRRGLEGARRELDLCRQELSRAGEAAEAARGEAEAAQSQRDAMKQAIASRVPRQGSRRGSDAQVAEVAEVQVETSGEGQGSPPPTGPNTREKRGMRAPGKPAMSKEEYVRSFVQSGLEERLGVGGSPTGSPLAGVRVAVVDSPPTGHKRVSPERGLRHGGGGTSQTRRKRSPGEVSTAERRRIERELMTSGR